jgi:hypothetical protein
MARVGEKSTRLPDRVPPAFLHGGVQFAHLHLKRQNTLTGSEYPDVAAQFDRRSFAQAEALVGVWRVVHLVPLGQGRAPRWRVG